MDISASAIKQSIENSQAAAALQTVSKAAENVKELNAAAVAQAQTAPVQSATAEGVGGNVDVQA